MLILVIRTDKPDAEIGLFEGEKKLQYKTWQAHRKLAETLHKEIKHLLENENLSIYEIEGLVAYEGPGSFTGLRIGLSVANALADGMAIPIVGTGNETWIKTGIKKIQKGINDLAVMPKYGSPPHITEPKH
jgi:tRNA threonylcarbamoyladenosine biosynthesis protein TsaB